LIGVEIRLQQRRNGGKKRTAERTKEILTSLMLVYIAQLFLEWLIRGAWRDPKGLNFPVSRDFAPEAVLPAIWEESGRAH
ncbi:hypothetical protein ACC719_36520, partial [Rhizobium ruizarguesonis]